MRIRILAIFLLLLYFLAVTLIVIQIVINPIIFGSIFLSLGLCLYGIWKIFTGKKYRWLWGCSLVVFSILISVFGISKIITERTDLRLLLSSFVVIGIYLLVFKHARQYYWRLRRGKGNKHDIKTKRKKAALIINPKAGGGRAVKADIPKKAKRLGIHVVIIKNGDDIQQKAESIVKSGYNVLGVSGGDGTLGAVASVAIKYNLPMVVIPGGTRCHFARDLGLDPVTIVDSLEAFGGVERKIDVGEINGRIFLNNASFGLYADIVDSPAYRDNKLSTTRKVLQEIIDGKRKPYRLTYRDYKGNLHKGAIQIVVSVNEYQTMRLLELGHRTKLDSGALQISVIPKLNDEVVRWLLTSLSFKKFFTNQMSDSLLQWTDEEFRLDSPESKIVVGVDGEREEYASLVKLSIRPKALKVLVPSEGVRSRPRSPIGKYSLSILWRYASSNKNMYKKW